MEIEQIHFRIESLKKRIEILSDREKFDKKILILSDQIDTLKSMLRGLLSRIGIDVNECFAPPS